MELSAALRQCLLGGKSGAGAGINLSSLSIVDGKVCWDLYIDGLVISMDGNVLDALGAAIKANIKKGSRRHIRRNNKEAAGVFGVHEQERKKLQDFWSLLTKKKYKLKELDHWGKV